MKADKRISVKVVGIVALCAVLFGVLFASRADAGGGGGSKSAAQANLFALLQARNVGT